MEKEKKKVKSQKVEVKKEEIKDIKKEEKKLEREIKSKKTNFKKIAIISGIIIVVGVIAFFVLKLFVLPPIKYNKANSKMEEHDYEKAVQLYESLGEYKDTKTKLDGAYFEYGKDLIKKEEYTKALKYLNNTSDSSKDDYVKYASALEKIQKGEYKDGIDSLKEMEDFEGVKESIQKGYYLQGESYLNDKKYDDAVKSFTEAGDYKDAVSKKNNALFITAEEYYKTGDLAKAKANYQKISSDYEYNNIKVSDRLNTLNKYSVFVSLAGDYSGSGKMVVKEIWKYNYSWESWYSSYVSSASIRCVITDDGKVKIIGSLDFYTYTNWSTISAYVNTKLITVPIAIEVSNGKVPSKLASNWPALVANSGTVGKANVKYKSGKLKLSFDLYDKNYSQSFAHRFTSNATLSKKK